MLLPDHRLRSSVGAGARDFGEREFYRVAIVRNGASARKLVAKRVLVEIEDCSS